MPDKKRLDNSKVAPATVGKQKPLKKNLAQATMGPKTDKHTGGESAEKNKPSQPTGKPPSVVGSYPMGSKAGKHISLEDLEDPVPTPKVTKNIPATVVTSAMGSKVPMHAIVEDSGNHKPLSSNLKTNEHHSDTSFSTVGGSKTGKLIDLEDPRSITSTSTMGSNAEKNMRNDSLAKKRPISPMTKNKESAGKSIFSSLSRKLGWWEDTCDLEYSDYIKREEKHLSDEESKRATKSSGGSSNASSGITKKEVESSVNPKPPATPLDKPPATPHDKSNITNKQTTTTTPLTVSEPKGKNLRIDPGSRPGSRPVSRSGSEASEKSVSSVDEVALDLMSRKSLGIEDSSDGKSQTNRASQLIPDSKIDPANISKAKIKTLGPLTGGNTSASTVSTIMTKASVGSASKNNDYPLPAQSKASWFVESKEPVDEVDNLGEETE